MKIHIVQKGDTLWNLAKKYNVDFEKLKAVNTHIKNPNKLLPGMKVKIPTAVVPLKPKKDALNLPKLPEMESNDSLSLAEEEEPESMDYKKMKPEKKPKALPKQLMPADTDNATEMPMDSKMMPPMQMPMDSKMMPPMPMYMDPNMLPPMPMHMFPNMMPLMPMPMYPHHMPYMPQMPYQPQQMMPAPMQAPMFEDDSFAKVEESSMENLPNMPPMPMPNPNPCNDSYVMPGTNQAYYKPEYSPNQFLTPHVPSMDSSQLSMKEAVENPGLEPETNIPQAHLPYMPPMPVFPGTHLPMMNIPPMLTMPNYGNIGPGLLQWDSSSVLDESSSL